MTRRSHLILLLTLTVAVPACRQKMSDQPSYRPLQASAFFRDGRASRPLLSGTVARGQLREDSRLYEGRADKQEFVAEFPFEMTAEVLERGEQRFNIYCSVCHGKTGDAGFADREDQRRGAALAGRCSTASASSRRQATGHGDRRPPRRPVSIEVTGGNSTARRAMTVRG